MHSEIITESKQKQSIDLSLIEINDVENLNDQVNSTDSSKETPNSSDDTPKKCS